MGYMDPYAFREEVREGQPLLYGPSGEPLRYIGQVERKEEFPDYEEPYEPDEGAGEELFGAKAEVGAELAGLLERAEEEEKEARKVREEKKASEKSELERRKGGAELERAKQREAMRKAGESRYQRVERTAKRGKATAAGVSGALVKVATFGGPMGKPSRDYYIPRAKKEMYIPTGMRPLTSVEGKGASGAILREAGTLRFGGLRQGVGPRMGDGGISSTPIGQLSRGIGGGTRTPTSMGASKLGSRTQVAAGDAALARLRGLTLPKGLSENETIAYSEIYHNGDVDVPSSVIDDLSKLGISRQDALTAIRSLLKKGHIKRSGQFGGESVLEVVR